MSRVKQLIQIINGCEKMEFDKIVKSYLKNIYGFERIVVTDGKNDTGIDIKVFDFGGLKNQYQMTVQKSGTPQEKSQLKGKIFEDVLKAKENIQYGYSNNLYFFYSYELTNKTQREYTREALNNYNINLFIIDANQIAEESEEYLELQQTIYNISRLDEFRLKKSLFEDKNKCLMYDLVGFGRCSDLKLEIVEAFILQCLYEKGPMKKDDIAEHCIQKFHSKENHTFYSKLINKLYDKEKRLEYNKQTKCYALSQKEYNIIQNKTEQIKLDEQSFINSIGAILKEYHQENNFDTYIKYLTDLYITSFTNRIKIDQFLDNLDRFLENEDEHINILLRYGKEQLNGQLAVAKTMISKLVQACYQNKYLQKSCASLIFSSKINIDNLEKYASERKQVFIDTTIALNILCLFYHKVNDNNDYKYQLSKALSEYCREKGIQLFLTNRYLWEITGHLKEAFDLIPFTKIPNFGLLGKSRNVFYNYYNYMYGCGIINYTFSEFLEDFGFNNSDIENTEKINQTFEHYLSEMNVHVLQIPRTYDIESTKKELENVLSELERYKTPFARVNDSIMLNYLGDPNVEVHNIDPVFITWDKSLYKILKWFHKNNPLFHKWMQFTPSQFIDRHSLLSFSIKTETISQEMLAILNGDIVQYTMSLLDSLSLILDPTTEMGLAYTKKITEMKDSQIYTIDKIPKEGQDVSDNDPIDIVVCSIVNLYRDTPDQYKKFKELFSKKEYFDDIIGFIDKSIKYYTSNSHFDKTIKSDFDSLINKMALCPSMK